MGTYHELMQHLKFIAAGIDDLVPYPEDDETPGCIECGTPSLDGQVKCAGCGYPEPLE